MSDFSEKSDIYWGWTCRVATTTPGTWRREMPSGELLRGTRQTNDHIVVT